MASPTCVQFIDQALTWNTPFPLSYADPQQKWLIRTDLLGLLRDNPGFSPSFGTFVHDDGTAAHLLSAEGPLRPSPAHGPPVHLTVWLHQNHPLTAPIVQLSGPVRRGHPFVALSGLATCPYLEAWSHPSRSDLSVLVRSLARLFSRDHPLLLLAPAPAPAPRDHPSMMSKLEALDRLAGSALYDLAAFRATASEEARALESLRDGAAEKARRLRGARRELEEERAGLTRAAAGLAERADSLVNFLRVNDRERIPTEIGSGIEEAFEAEPSPWAAAVMELAAAERGAEDAMYALEKAVEGGIAVVGVEDYVKQVRLLAREQFVYRAKLVKLGASGFLSSWGYC